MPDGSPETSPDAAHLSVLFDEVMEALCPRSGGYVAVDCTANGGGHSFGLLERSSPDGRVVALDADASALARASERLAPFGDRAQLVHSNFSELESVAAELQLGTVDAILFDLGLSSVQLDSSGRGFSFRYDEPLDMRFDVTSDEPTAADLLNDSEEEELARILRDYGEERGARRIARTIVQQRATTPFRRTADLVSSVIRVLGPPRRRIHPATRTFQALRIAVNDELGVLERALDVAVHRLSPGGRLAVISFHSLEDRIVKWRFRGWASDESSPALVRIVTKRPLIPSEAEIHANPRARSAKLRVAERLNPDEERSQPWR
jgi:16S rRNA (cytosine1402-N4)-methyltransferase